MKNKSMTYCMSLCFAMMNIVVNASAQTDDRKTDLVELKQLAQQNLKESSIFVQGYAAFQSEDQQINDACLRVGQDLAATFSCFDINPIASKLVIACQKNNRQILPNKFNINGHNELGDTPLTQAAYKGSTERVKALLYLGADAHVQAGEQKSFRTPLQAAQEPLIVRHVGGLDFTRIPVLGYFLKPLTPVKIEQINKSEVINILSDVSLQK